MKRFLAFLALILCICTVPAAQPNVPLYVHWDGTIAAPTQFLNAVFKAGPSITITDHRTNLIISVAGGGNATTNFVVATATDLTNLVFTISANGTNFTYQIGANNTNYANGIFLSLSNFSVSILGSATNFTLAQIFAVSNSLYSAIGSVGITNLGSGTNISIRVSGGTNFVDTIGELNNWAQILTNAITVKLDSNVWHVSWGALSTNALSGKLDSNAFWGNLEGTGALTNWSEPLSVSNVWSGVVTQGVVDFGARKVVWNLTNGITFTNLAALEAGLGTKALVLEMWVQGCSNAMPALTFPTFGGSSYGVHIFTNDWCPIFTLVTNATRQWLLWEAHGTNITLDNRIYF